MSRTSFDLKVPTVHTKARISAYKMAVVCFKFNIVQEKSEFEMMDFCLYQYYLENVHGKM